MLPNSTRLGPYEIVGLLGSGGMGEVYRARDTRLGREVAVKVLRGAFAADQDRLARFEREARAVAALAHPNILVLYDVGSAGGTPYVVTELLEGNTLRQRLTRETLPWRAAVEFGIAIADGLAAAHAKGIVHRDLKPENVFLTADGRTKLLDFGLARWGPPTALASDLVSYAPTVTAAGAVMGTIGYMAPEQVRGQAVDARGDIFSLGCVLYEMVSGQRPFARGTPAETQAAILMDEPPKLADMGRPVPAALERVIRRCLQKRPEERFQSGQELALALRHLAGGTDAGRRGPGLSGRRLGRAIAMIVVLGAVALVGTQVAQDRKRPGPGRSGAGAPAPVSPIESIAVLPLVDTSHDPRFEFLSAGVPRTMIRSLLEIQELKVRPFSSVAQYAGDAQPDPREIGRQLDVQAVLAGTIAPGEHAPNLTVELLDVRNNRSLWLQSYDLRQDLLFIQDDLLQEVAAKLGWQLSARQRERLARRPTQDTAAYLEYLEGLHHIQQWTVDDSRRGIDRLERALARDPGFALAHASLADAYIAAAYIFMQPRVAFEKARQAAAEAMQLDSLLAEAHAGVATVSFHVDWDWVGAGREFEQAVSLNPRCTFAQDYLGWYWIAQGQPDSAIAALQRAVELEPRSHLYNSDLAFLYVHARRYDAAEQQAQRTLELDPNSAMAPWALSMVYAHRDRNYPAALVQAQEFLERDPQRPDAYGMLGWIHGMSGQRRQALEVLDQVRQLSRDVHIRGEVWAWIYTGLGDRDAAFRSLNQVCDERSPGVVYFAMDPLLDPLRADPRFSALLRRIGVPAHPSPPGSSSR